MNQKIANPHLVIEVPKPSGLVNGKIPAFTDCPYNGSCNVAKAGQCGHFDKDHPVPYSCALARLLKVIGNLIQKVNSATNKPNNLCQ